jgi:phosphoserine aminotransferase
MTASATEQRVYNFSAGPATMPVSVLKEIQDEMMCLPGVGASVMEISHRGKPFIQIMEAAEASIRKVMNISNDYAVLLVQGGSGLQFSMVPANLLRGSGKTAHYMVTGAWSEKAIVEAYKEGNVEAIYDSSESNFNHVPKPTDYEVPQDSAYLYYCSNETIHGVQFPDEPHVPAGVPLVADVSSDFLCRPVDINRYGLMYACAQKNAGPAGVTVVIIHRDLLARSADSLPGYLNYKNHSDADSMWNTPPTFAVYVLGKVVDWIINDVGGLEKMHQINLEKAKIVYDALDAHAGFYKAHAQADCRSLMNVTFNLPSDALLKKFDTEATANRLDGMKGHRSVGGIRASIYNAMPLEGAQALASFMSDFAAKNG